MIATPEMIAAAATDLANIGSTLDTANGAAAATTTEVVAAGADQVSASVAAFLGAHGQAYQALSAQAAAFHAQFVQALTAGTRSYASAEAANVAAFKANPAQTIGQDLTNLINAPTELVLGRPLIGNGANGAPGTGQAGGAGGILWGNGGNGGSGATGLTAVTAGPPGYSATAAQAGWVG